MAAEITTPFAAGDPVTFSTPNPDITGASGSFTTVVTGDASGSIVSSILFRAVTRTPEEGTLIMIYYNTGAARRNVGAVRVEPGRQHSEQGDVWSALWIPPQPYLPNGDSYDVAPISGSTVYHAIAAGGDIA